MLELDFIAVKFFCSSLDGIWTHTIVTLQHHSLSLTSSALDHSTISTPLKRSFNSRIYIYIYCHILVFTELFFDEEFVLVNSCEVKLKLDVWGFFLLYFVLFWRSNYAMVKQIYHLKNKHILQSIGLYVIYMYFICSVKYWLYRLLN